MLLVPAVPSAREFSIKAGVYDFTDAVSKEFYKIAPALILAFDLHQVKKIALNLSSGISGSSVMYNAKRHNLIMVPVFLTIQYHLADSGTLFQPYVAAGVSLHMKWDKNPWFESPHYIMTYGYNMHAGLDIPIKQKLVFTIDIKYNILIPSAMEDLNVSGIVSTIGIKIPVRSRRKKLKETSSDLE